jgi:hypothetical protein
MLTFSSRVVAYTRNFLDKVELAPPMAKLSSRVAADTRKTLEKT